ncbi:MAG: hypothetical protein LUF92_10275 [Clostridiales bacterium]|nr:hypothetical protein [Clostridiales bacterium]
MQILSIIRKNLASIPPHNRVYYNRNQKIGLDIEDANVNDAAVDAEHRMTWDIEGGSGIIMLNKFKNFIYEVFEKSYNNAKAYYISDEEDMFLQQTLDIEGPSALFEKIKKLEKENNQLRRENQELQNSIKCA